jgi:hypothetical protein
MVRLKKEVSSELHSVQSLGNSVARIEQLLVPARRVAAEMERLKMGPILISTQPSFECALDDLSRWGKACEDAMTGKLKEIGHFKAEGTISRMHPPAKKAVKGKKSRK